MKEEKFYMKLLLYPILGGLAFSMADEYMLGLGNFGLGVMLGVIAGLLVVIAEVLFNISNRK